MLKYAILRLESKEWAKLVWGKVRFPYHVAVQVPDYQQIREVTRGIMGTVVAHVDIQADPLDNANGYRAFERFHRDNCACARINKHGDRLPCNLEYQAR